MAITSLSMWLSGTRTAGFSKTLVLVAGVTAPLATAAKTVAVINNVLIMLLFRFYVTIFSLTGSGRTCATATIRRLPVFEGGYCGD